MTDHTEYALSRALSSLPEGPLRQAEIAKAHRVDCLVCGEKWLLREDHCSECPFCESEHQFNGESIELVTAY